MTDPGDLTERMRRFGTHPIEPERHAADLAAMARVGPRAARRGPFGSRARVAAAFLAGLVLGGTGLAAADALPDPAQHMAHTVLSQVGVDVPNPPRYHGPECGAEVKRNHGAYVRDDHSLAQSDCGKPVGAGGVDDTGATEGDRDTGGNAPGASSACHGKPPWAGNTSMTSDEVAAAKAARATQCGAETGDRADDTADDRDEPESSEVNPETTTTVLEPTTTVLETTTTESATTTTDG